MKSAQKILRQMYDLQNNLREGLVVGPEWFGAVIVVLEEVLRDEAAGRFGLSKQLLNDIKHCLDMLHNINFSKKSLTQTGINVLGKVMAEITDELRQLVL